MRIAARLTSVDHHEGDGLWGGQIAKDSIPSLMCFSVDRERNRPLLRGSRWLVARLAIVEEW
jgi:hypothetical protein